MDLKLSRFDVQKYCRENSKIVNLYSIASEDYIAARCCFYNTLLEQSYVLACQAIEKVLKAFLLCLNPSENIRKYNNHKLIPLMNKIEKLGGYNLEKHSKIASKLWETYEMFRYPDNKLEGVYKKYSYGDNEIDLIDSFFLELLELITIPDEVKFRIGIYVSLYEDSLVKNVPQQQHWATYKNKTLVKKNEELNNLFLIVRNHLYK